MNPPSVQHEKIQDFINELTGFAQTAEQILNEIQEDLEGKKGSFSFFSERMVAIRGTALQLKLDHIAHIAGLGEEIAVKGAVADSRPKIRKCVGSLWDALTTVKYLLVHYDKPTDEEQDILIHRLESTLTSLGGARPTVDESEIEKILKERT